MSPEPSPRAEFALEADGRARSTRFDDIYQPDQDGGQARAVFVAGSRFVERLAGRSEPFRVLELGFGTGGNFLEFWRAWRATDTACALEYLGVDGYPLSPEEAAHIAHARATPVERDQAALLAAWPQNRPGVHDVDLAAARPDGQRAPALRLWHTDFEGAVAALAGSAAGTLDAVLLDGFAPSKNPAAWSPSILAGLGTIVRPGGSVATWSVAGSVRRGLLAAGFRVTRCPGFGRKKERLEAWR